MTFSFQSLLTRRMTVSGTFAAGMLVGWSADAHALSAPQRMMGSPSFAQRSSTFEQPSDAPYLLKLGAAALRFAEPPPEATERPAPPPQPVIVPPPLPTQPTKVELPTEEPVAPAQKPMTAAEPPPLRTQRYVEPPKVERGEKPKPPKAVSILPDEAPAEAKPEDLLPFFEMPQSSGSSAPINPTASSATYRQR